MICTDWGRGIDIQQPTVSTAKRFHRSRRQLITEDDRTSKQHPILIQETAVFVFDEIIAEVPLVLRQFPASSPRTSKSYKRRKSDGKLEEGNRRRKGRDVGREEKLRHPPKALC